MTTKRGEKVPHPGYVSREVSGLEIRLNTQNKKIDVLQQIQVEVDFSSELATSHDSKRPKIFHAHISKLTELLKFMAVVG